MTSHHGQLGPPLSLSERLEQLNNNLHFMGDRLKEAIASAISAAVADAVRDALHGLLGNPQIPPRHQDNRWQDRHRPDNRWAEEDDRDWSHRPWNDPDDADPWQEREFEEPEPQRRSSHTQQTRSNRLQNTLNAALQASLWWLQEQKKRRPVMATGVVALAAGMTAFFYGPVMAAGMGALASVVSLLLTTDGTRLASERLADLVGG